MSLSKQDWTEWQAHPVTNALYDYLRLGKETVIQNIAVGSDGYSLDILGAKLMAMRAELAIIEGLMALEVEDLNNRNL